ncbi:hypothetical protein Dsin_006682 [Dipteronia sinensis]|uniref:Uncharacterized protein n=1 Tax=Dipteronia sinensis TaxID=43782 RepID=A0AAE0AZR7_9ROSI|nr:hypothetical protein Dsin_006682 [Dipteronia sinensis]
MARLDNFLISHLMLNWFPKLVQRGLFGSLSNHIVIMIGEPKQDWGPYPFRFYNDWLEDNEAMKEASKWWKECKATRSRSFIISAKLKASKKSIKNWLSMKKSKDPSLDHFEMQLADIEKRASIVRWTDGLRNERLNIISNYWKEL